MYIMRLRTWTTSPASVVRLGWLVAVGLSGTLLASHVVATDDQILLNFRDVDITQLVIFMSDLTGKTFLVDHTVRGTITLVAPQPMSRDDVYQVFLAALHSRGFAAVSQGAIVKILPARKARSSPIPYRD